MHVRMLASNVNKRIQIDWYNLGMFELSLKSAEVILESNLKTATIILKFNSNSRFELLLRSFQVQIQGQNVNFGSNFQTDMIVLKLIE